MEKAKLTVCICAKDRSTELAMLLESLRHQTFKDFNVVIVDGSEAPNGAPIDIRKYSHFINRAYNQLIQDGHWITYKRENNKGIARCRNQARELANTEICLALDDDEVLEPDYIEKLYKVITSDEKIAAVGGVVPVYGQPTVKRKVESVKPIFNEIKLTNEGDFICSNCGEVFKSMKQNPLVCANCKQHYLSGDSNYLYDKEEVIESHHLQSGYMFRKSAVEEVGGRATDKTFSAFREETELCMLLRLAGYKLITHTGAIAWHDHAPRGGARQQGPQKYSKNVVMDDGTFRKKIKKIVQEKGWNK